MRRFFALRPIICVAAITAAFLLYILGLSTNPPGAYVDETGLAYNAYLVARTGAGEFGPIFPLYFELFTGGFTAYTSPSQIYLLAAVFLLLPPSMYIARIFSALWVFSGCVLMGVLARRLSQNTGVGIVVAFLALLMPWFYDIRGLLLEAHFLPFAITVFLIAVQRAASKNVWGWLDAAFIAGGLCLVTYCYTSGRGLSVILAGGLAIFATKRAHLFGVLKTWALYGAGLFPILVYNYRNPGVLTRRLYEVSSFNAGMTWAQTITTVAGRFWEDLGLTPLLMNGDHHARHHVQGSGGAIFYATFCLAILSLITLIARWRINRWWLYVVFGLFASMVPGAVANEPFHQLRMMGYPVFMLVMTVPAIEWLIGYPKETPAVEGVERPQVSSIAIWIKRSLLMTALIATVYQFVGYHSVFRERGPQRLFDFDVPYRRVYQAAVAQPERPIYLQDGKWGPRYITAFWFAVEEGRPVSEFYHLGERERPPFGSIVLSSEEPACTNCDVIEKSSVYTLYRQK